MGQVNVTVNGRPYVVGCDDGSESHVLHLAEYLNSRIKELVGSVGQAGEIRLLLMAALTISDDLFTANQDQENLRLQLAELRGALREGADRKTLEIIFSRLEAVADRLEKA